jgi:hypothetical protein
MGPNLLGNDAGQGFSFKDCAALTADLGVEFFNFQADLGECMPVDAGS